MKILFVGEYGGNTGPANVNRKLISNWFKKDDVRVIKSSSKVLGAIEGLIKAQNCDVALFSNNSMVDVFLHDVIRRFGKPCICFNHGFAPQENELNHGGLSESRMNAIRRHMEQCDVVIANSELQMHTLKKSLNLRPSQLTYVYLGVDRFDQMPTARDTAKCVIAVSGGTRPIKANEIVARSVRLLEGQGIECELRVYGRNYAANDELVAMFDSENVIYKGQVPQEEFVNQLADVNVFVMNSRHEPFGLSAIDALRAGCSVLLSQNCGVAGILSLTEEDVVDDCEDPDEVARKIEGLFHRPNAERLYSSLDFEELSWKKVADKLRESILTCFPEL